MRIAIIGNSGSGKSTLAKWFAIEKSLPQLDLDTVAWEPGQVAVPRPPDAAQRDVRAFCEAKEHWVVEGCYAGLVAAALPSSPLLLFLEPGVQVCLTHCRNRPWEPHKYPSKQAQDEQLAFLLNWVTEYYVRDGDMSLRAHESLYEQYLGPKRKLVEPIEPGQLAELVSVR